MTHHVSGALDAHKLHGAKALAERHAGGAKGGQKLEEVAHQFEAMFVKMLLDQMPEESEGPLSGGFGGGVWRDV